LIAEKNEPRHRDHRCREQGENIMTTHTDNFHALAVDNIKMQAEQFREISAEELEMASGGGFWGDIVDIINQVTPRIPVLPSLL
jgi:hypothetical protein